MLSLYSIHLGWVIQSQTKSHKLQKIHSKFFGQVRLRALIPTLVPLSQDDYDETKFIY